MLTYYTSKLIGSQNATASTPPIFAQNGMASLAVRLRAPLSMRFEPGSRLNVELESA
jgi:hypothetical protein